MRACARRLYHIKVGIMWHRLPLIWCIRNTSKTSTNTHTHTHAYRHQWQRLAGPYNTNNSLFSNMLWETKPDSNNGKWWNDTHTHSAQLILCITCCIIFVFRKLFPCSASTYFICNVLRIFRLWTNKQTFDEFSHRFFVAVRLCVWHSCAWRESKVNMHVFALYVLM